MFISGSSRRPDQSFFFPREWTAFRCEQTENVQILYRPWGVSIHRSMSYSQRNGFSISLVDFVNLPDLKNPIFYTTQYLQCKSNILRASKSVFKMSLSGGGERRYDFCCRFFWLKGQVFLMMKMFQMLFFSYIWRYSFRPLCPLKWLWWAARSSSTKRGMKPAE